jgi:hypothetical protein
MRKAIFTAALVGLGSGVLACGGGESAGLGPPPTTVDGGWNFTIQNLHATIQGSLLTCKVTGATVTLTQTGTDFSGTYSGGTMTCTYQGQSQSFAIAGDVVNGILIGNAVSFDLDAPDFHFTGTAGQNSMSGTCTLTADFGSPIGVVVLNGSWRLSR